MNKRDTWLGLGGAGFLGAAIIAAVVFLPGAGAAPATIAPNNAASADTSSQVGSVNAGALVKEPANSAPEVPSIITPPSDQTAPDFRGIVQWLNSPPLTLPELQGQVVLVDFWTYSCINCQRTIPYVRDWHNKYSDHGLVVVGVHSPEFSFEKVESNVREALVQQKVTWPVAMDNDFRTWRAYENRWWPHAFLIDQDGLVRYDHIGEGAYQETEWHIRNLLTEAGHDVSEIPLGLQ